MAPKIGTAASEPGNLGRVVMTPVIGDSGVALITPQAGGKADLYGMMTASSAACCIHGPYGWTKPELWL